MRRRDILRGGASVLAFGSGRTKATAGQRRAAVVVGVDKVGDLPKLRAAASGAASIAQWLSVEGFDVKLLTDAQGPVTVTSFKDAVRSCVESPAGLDQLVVYFAGHGFVSGASSEFWLLSQAPDDPDAAVSLSECPEPARKFDIANVVFISDACRSAADSLRAGSMRGSLIFPTGSGGKNVTTEVDKFLATRIGYSAYEVGVAEAAQSFRGIYTTCLLEAFKRPYNDIVRPDGDRFVIPNRRLREFLAVEVPRMATQFNSGIEQHPDAEVCSDEPAFIAHVSSSDRTARSGPDSAATIADVATRALNLRALSGSSRLSTEKLLELASSSGFTSAQELVTVARGLPAGTGSRCGFTLSGSEIAGVISRPGIRVAVLPGASAKLTQVEVGLGGQRAASVAILFPDRSGSVLAAIDGYVANVLVEEGRVLSVTYAPSPQSGSASMYRSAQLDELHASAAAAAKYGVLRFEGPRDVRVKEAREFAGRIRVLKGVDPTLGVYAAYAYAEADLPGEIRSVRAILRDDLRGVDLFDIAMLAGELTGKSQPSTDLVPFVPMLSQGWGLLRVKDVRLPEGMLSARELLRPSLWSTLLPAGMALALKTLTSGKVT